MKRYLYVERPAPSSLSRRSTQNSDRFEDPLTGDHVASGYSRPDNICMGGGGGVVSPICLPFFALRLMFGFRPRQEVVKTSPPGMMPFSTLPPAPCPPSGSSAARGSPPSRTVPLDCANGVCPPSRPGDDLGAVVGGEHHNRVGVDAMSFNFFMPDTDISPPRAAAIPAS